MEPALFSYLESNLFSSFFLSILLVRTVRSGDWQLKQIFFSRVLFFYILYFIVDGVWICFEFNVFSGILPHFIVNLLCYIIGSCSSFYWFLYSESVQGNRNILLRKNRMKFGIPLVIVVIIFSLFFIIMEFGFKKSLRNGHYYYLVTTVTVFFYLLLSCIRSFKRVHSKIDFDNESVSYLMGIYPIIFLFGSILQIIFLYIPILCYVVVIDLFCVYLGCLDKMISIDSLTKLNNRNQLNRYLSYISSTSNDRIWIFFMDVDKFKLINDTYGHLAGDKALVIISDTLKKCCKINLNKFFLARYGGDEFIIIANEKRLSKPKKFKHAIEKALNDVETEKKLDYKLSVSIGYYLADLKKYTIAECLSFADNNLYNEKNQKKNKV